MFHAYLIGAAVTAVVLFLIQAVSGDPPRGWEWVDLILLAASWPVALIALVLIVGRRLIEPPEGR